MQKFYGRVTDANGIPVASARLTVYLATVLSPLPPIFAENSDGSLRTQANPLLTNADGEYAFIVRAGEYQIRATGSSAVLNISKTVTQYTPQAPDDQVSVVLNVAEYTINAAWTAPAGVVQATITAVGGGAGGARADLSGPTAAGGVGGGAGATVVRTVPVTPGVAYTIAIGAGGAGGTTGAGADGGDTTFGSMVTARGGKADGNGGRGTSLGLGGTNDLNVVANTSAPLFYGRGGICAGGDGGIGGVTGGRLTASSGYAVESYPGGAGGDFHVPATQTVGGGGGGASVFGAGGDGGDNATGANTGGNGSPGGIGAGGGGGATGATTPGNGGAGGGGLCRVEWIS